MIVSEGYLTGLGLAITFLILFTVPVSVVVHGLYHYVNHEFHKYCPWCNVGKWMN